MPPRVTNRPGNPIPTPTKTKNPQAKTPDDTAKKVNVLQLNKGPKINPSQQHNSKQMAIKVTSPATSNPAYQAPKKIQTPANNAAIVVSREVSLASAATEKSQNSDENNSPATNKRMLHEVGTAMAALCKEIVADNP